MVRIIRLFNVGVFRQSALRLYVDAREAKAQAPQNLELPYISVSRSLQYLLTKTRIDPAIKHSIFTLTTSTFLGLTMLGLKTDPGQNWPHLPTDLLLLPSALVNSVKRRTGSSYIPNDATAFIIQSLHLRVESTMLLASQKNKPFLRGQKMCSSAKNSGQHPSGVGKQY